MLVELAVANLGVIAELRLDVGPGLCALTGETGAGKTMIIESLALLRGGKADPSRVRPGATEAVVEGRFVDGDDEIILRRVIPATGRSRSYINGSMATVSELAEATEPLIEICGQHSHQQLQSVRAQRDALDRFGAIDLTDWSAARAHRRELEAALLTFGGDDRARAREIDLLRFQVDELDAASLGPVDEDDALSETEDVLADALAHLESGSSAAGFLSEEGQAADLIASALAEIDHRRPYAEVAERLGAVGVELGDIISELRGVADGIEPDPQRLETIRQRRQLLVDLRRKYGESIEEVLAYHREVAERLEDLQSHEQRAAELESQLVTARAAEASLAAAVAAKRRAAAPKLAAAVARRLAEVAMAGARVEISVGDIDPGDDVEFRMSANAGMEPQPIAKAASGGELSRTMLALHQVLSAGAPTMIFDEVDAGVGGSAATAVGQALARLAVDRQVLVVTHLPQVAAYADVQVSVSKSAKGLAVSTIARLSEDDRVIELSRMLSGSPDSETARRHAEELLELAEKDRVH